MKQRIVLALGGNALGNSPKEQLKLVEKTASAIIDLIEEGYEVVIGHGNGPQVGMVNLSFDNSYNQGITPLMPFAECGAMTQGYIGYHLQQSLQKELNKRNINKNVVTIITQVEVDSNDEAFNNPSKPIGSFYTKEEAEKINKETGYIFIEDAGRGYRRVVASPMPKKIIELDVVKQLLDNGNIVITVGGGGIPVIYNNDGYQGIDAVIDKDRACSRLALDLNADMLVILTAVEKVFINFNKDNQKALDSISVDEAIKFIKEEQFGKGSMLPKIEACIDYVKNSNGQALITSLEKAKEGLKGNTGTIIK